MFIQILFNRYFFHSINSGYVKREIHNQHLLFIENSFDKESYFIKLSDIVETRTEALFLSNN